MTNFRNHSFVGIVVTKVSKPYICFFLCLDGRISQYNFCSAMGFMHEFRKPCNV